AYSHVLEIRLVDEVDAPQIPACLLSESGMVRCFHPDTPKGEAGADGRAIAPWRQWFDAAWLRAHPPVEGRRLGI
ncbi:hypothetical protein, partial [Chitinimonas sp.]|uniref:hypothetical protein n=1 Tax=Chitinimonas sp. TaxID=1934313 RepID=UPI0035B3966C